MTELERYKLAYTVAMDHLANFGTTYKQAFEECHAILNPPPAVVTEDVVRWYCPVCNATYASLGTGLCCDPNGGLIELRGTLTREVQKVERSVSRQVWMDKDGAPWNKPLEDYQGKVDIFPEAANKTGTLTFVWEE